MEPVRWGILGAANIALARTLPALAAATGAAPIALASRRPDAVRAAVLPFGIERIYSDYDALLADSAVEVVYVPTANTEHFLWCVRALEAGKHVLCEKPLVLSSAQAEQLIAVRDRTGRHIEEAFSYRNHPQWADIGSTIEDRVIGSPRSAHAVLAKHFRNPDDIRNNPLVGGGALYDLGSYAISAMHQVFRRPPLRVSATVEIDPKFGVDQLTSAILDYGDAQGLFTVGIRSGPDAWATHQQFSVLGETGWLACDFPFAHARPTECRLMIGDTGSVGLLPSSTQVYAPVDQYRLQVERFSRLVRGEPARAWLIEDALLTLRVIEAVFESGRTGAAVALQFQE